MALPLARNSRARCGDVWQFLLLLAPLFGISLTGCNDTCFIFTSNPPTGTINVKAGDPKPTCMLTKANAAVRVLARTASPCESCSPSTRIAHLFVSLLGVEVHPSAIADDASPDWRELMQQSPGQPPRFDLISASRGAPLPLGEVATIPADAYRQVRLRFAADQPTSNDFGPEEIACDRTAFNCVVLEDGRAYPLLFHGAPPVLRISSASLADRFLLIPPDSNSNLVIEINIAWTLSSSAGGTIRLLPVLTGSASVERRPAERIDERQPGKLSD
jgi:Domain of unknown function (DUF4382)